MCDQVRRDRRSPPARGSLLVSPRHLAAPASEGALSGLEPRKRGRKPKKIALARKLAESEAKNRKLERRLQEAQMIIEFQKKVAEVLGIPLTSPESGGRP